MSAENEARANEELTKFGILAGVMAIVVLVVALSRPLIFGHIVPVIMGEGIVITAPIEELTPQIIVPAIIEEGGELGDEGDGMVETMPESAPVEGEPVDDAGSGMVETAPIEEPAAAAEPAAEVVAPPVSSEGDAPLESEAAVQSFLAPASPLVHTVKTGDTLTAIAAQYNVSIDAIVAANGLFSANQIKIGDQLTIPQP